MWRGKVIIIEKWNQIEPIKEMVLDPDQNLDHLDVNVVLDREVFLGGKIDNFPLYNIEGIMCTLLFLKLKCFK